MRKDVHTYLDLDPKAVA